MKIKYILNLFLCYNTCVVRSMFDSDDIIDYMIVNGDFDDKEEAKEEIDRLKNLGLTNEEISLVVTEGWDETSFIDDEDEELEDDDYYNDEI